MVVEVGVVEVVEVVVVEMVMEVEVVVVVEVEVGVLVLVVVEVPGDVHEHGAGGVGHVCQVSAEVAGDR